MDIVYQDFADTPTQGFTCTHRRSMQPTVPREHPGMGIVYQDFMDTLTQGSICQLLSYPNFTGWAHCTILGFHGPHVGMCMCTYKVDHSGKGTVYTIDTASHVAIHVHVYIHTQANSGPFRYGHSILGNRGYSDMGTHVGTCMWTILGWGQYTRYSDILVHVVVYITFTYVGKLRTIQGWAQYTRIS